LIYHFIAKHKIICGSETKHSQGGKTTAMEINEHAYLYASVDASLKVDLNKNPCLTDPT
jgi:hypothetical protein